MKTIDGKVFKNMLISGANNLYNYYPEVDALNVFPVPDGDTGMNMNLTMTNGAKEIANRNDVSIYAIAKTFSRALLFGARGNSGVITSQFFRGIAEGLIDKESVNISELAEAFESGRKFAYKGVLTPVEGTILTVIRESSDKLNESLKSHMSIEDGFKILLNEARESLKRTPNLLPILKEVGVVDSGGAGLVKIFEGMYSALLGNFIERNENAVIDNSNQAVQTKFKNDDNFGYCTEFILKLGPEDNKKIFNKNRFTNVLNSHGNSLVVVQDEDIVKVHVHTLKPGDIFNYAQQFGEFLKLKCENMSEQHHEILLKEMEEKGFDVSNNSELKSAPLTAPKEEKVEEKEFALIATSSGKGIDDLFHQVGVEYIVSGGQTMNPSTNDFVDSIKKTNAKNVYIFPNNGNIILAANQAKDVLEGKVNVFVLPTKTIMQGVVSAMNFNPDLSSSDNYDVMLEAINNVKSGAITYAIKDTEMNGLSIKKGEFMSIRESKDIISTNKDKIKALFDLLDALIDEDSAVCTILTGNDISSEEFDSIKKTFEEKYDLIDLDIREGNQPVYSFIVGVE